MMIYVISIDMLQSRRVKIHVKRLFFFNMCKRKDDLVMSLENSAKQTFSGIESLELRDSNLQFMKMTTTRTFHYEKHFKRHAWYTWVRVPPWK